MAINSFFRFSNLIRLLLLAAFFLILYQVFSLISLSYGQFLSWATELLGRADLVEKIQANIGPADFQRVQLFGKLAILPFAIITLFLLVKANAIASFILHFFQFIGRSWRGFTQDLKSQPVLFVTVFLLISALYLVKAYWYVFHWPMQYDEAWTFNHFINKSWIVPLTAPHNNHILYTLVAKLFYHVLPFFRPIVAIRFCLPLFGLGSALVLYRFAQKRWNANMALLTYALFLSCGPIIFYALYARAYLVSIFFCILFLYSFVELYTGKADDNTNRSFHQVFAVLSAVFSIYALPISVYFLLPVVAVVGGSALWRNFANLKSLSLIGIFILIGVLVLYAPMLVATKFAWLTDGLNSKSSFHIHTVFKKHIIQTGVYFTSIREMGKWIYYPILLLSALAIFVFQKNRKVFVLIFISLVMPMVYMYLHQKFMYTRLFSYNAIFYALIVAAWVYWLIKQFRLLQIAPIFALVFFLFFSYRAHFQWFFNWSNPWDNSTEEIFEVLKEHKVHENYNFFYYAKPALEYYSFERKHPLRIAMPQESSISHESFGQKQWQSVIWWKDYRGEQPDFSDYKIIWEEGDFKVYMPQ